MSRPPASTRNSASRCGPCWRRSRGRRSSSCPPTRPRTSRPCASASSCWTGAGSATTVALPNWSTGPPAGSGSPTSPTRRRPCRGGPAPVATATSPRRRGTASNMSNRPSRTPTCCCGRARRAAGRSRERRRDRDGRCRPHPGGRPPVRLPRAGRPRTAPVRRQPDIPVRSRHDRLDRGGPGAGGRGDRQRGRIPGGLPGWLRDDRHVLADPVDARQRAGRGCHTDGAAGAYRGAVRCRDPAVPLRLGGPGRVRHTHLPGRLAAVRGVQRTDPGRHPRRADRRPVARRPAARCRAGPLGELPGGRVRAVPGHLRLAAAGDHPVVDAPGRRAGHRSAAVLAVRVLVVRRQRPRRHPLARIPVVLHRLAACPVRDRGAGRAAARGGGPDAVPAPAYASGCLGVGRGDVRAGHGGQGQHHRDAMMIMTSLRAGAWPAVLGFSGVAVVVGVFGVAFPAATTVMFTIAFTLLAAAAAFALDEPASQVVDVTPTGLARRTGIRALALLAPVAAGTVLILAGAQRGLALPWAATGLALGGNVVLGFTV